MKKYAYGSDSVEYEYDGYERVSKQTAVANGTTVVRSYGYDNQNGGRVNAVSTGGFTQRISYDELDRVTENVYEENNVALHRELMYYLKSGDHATEMVTAIRYGIGDSLSDSIKYVYDKAGNISEIYENGKFVCGYGYDELNRLVKETRQPGHKVTTYTYDINGNKLAKREYGYINGENLLNLENEYLYEYASDWKDQLTSYAGKKMEYDSLGNPTKYKDKTLEWEKCRRLKSYDGLSFTYDGFGKRTGKGSVKYYYAGDELIKEVNGSNTIVYYRDGSGIRYITVNGSKYIYRKNLQGDVTHIYNASGTLVAKYEYDAWGNHTVQNPDGSENTSSTFIGNINPIRYRSYYYDKETGLYYLKSRYYDPEIGRFINADDLGILTLTKDYPNGIMLYNYCCNNPVMNVDEGGDMPKWLKWLAGAAIIVASVAVSIVTAGLAAPIATSLGGGIVGSIVGGAVAGAVGGAISGFGISVGMQGAKNGFDNINWSQAGKATLSGAISGAAAGGIFGGIKHVMSASKIANSLSGLSKAQANFDKASTVLKNTPITFNGGVMSTERIAAQLSFDTASASLSFVKSSYNTINFMATQGYNLAQFASKQIIGYFINGWL